jgi:hypothetical protein
MRVLKSYWYLILSILELIGAVVYLGNAWSEPAKYRTVFYYADQTTFLLACIIIPLSILITAIQIFRILRKGTSSPKMRYVFASLIFFAVANLIACGAIFPLMLNRSTSLDSIYLENHVYRLDSMFSPGIGGDHSSVLILWECDNKGWFCHIFYTKDFYKDMIAKLKSDHDTQAIILTINDQEVFRYKP